jgi:deazaflavin-dependent oxidoreductase (nitroreductase family)
MMSNSNPQGDDRLAIVASNGGSPAHPDWYYNLKANPRISVEVGTQTFTVLAEELDGAARAGLWPKLVTQSPAVGEHQARPRDRFRSLCSSATTELRPDADMLMAQAYRLPDTATSGRRW